MCQQVIHQFTSKMLITFKKCLIAHLQMSKIGISIKSISQFSGFHISLTVQPKRITYFHFNVNVEPFIFRNKKIVTKSTGFSLFFPNGYAFGRRTASKSNMNLMECFSGCAQLSTNKLWCAAGIFRT